MMEDTEQYYPPKPPLEKQQGKRHLSITVASIVLFVLTFSFILNDYYLILLLLGVLLIHEMGHFAFMKLFKYKDLNLLFIPFIGAMVSGRKEVYSQKEIVIMVMAGPLPGILIGACMLLYGNLKNPFVLQLGVLFVLLNVLNLIPFQPLDGGQLMRNLFIRNQIRYELYQLISNVIISFGLAILGIALNSWWIIIFGLLIGFRVKHKHKMYLIRKNMKEEKIKFDSNYNDLSNKTYAKIKSIIINFTPSLSKLKEFDGTDEYNRMMANQVDGALYPPTQNDAHLGFKLFMAFAWGLGISLSVYSLYMLNLNTVIHAFQFGR